jgi:hypothetical protein
MIGGEVRVRAGVTFPGSTRLIRIRSSRGCWIFGRRRRLLAFEPRRQKYMQLRSRAQRILR